ncbi:hypothetical protein NJB1907E19_15880, partial [Mycobacterium marinum]
QARSGVPAATAPMAASAVSSLATAVMVGPEALALRD